MKKMIAICSLVMTVGGLIVIGDILYEYFVSGDFRMGLLGMGIIPIMSAIILLTGSRLSERKIRKE